MDYDGVLVQIGEFGWYQRVQCGLLFLLAVPMVFSVMGYVFWGARPNHWCSRPIDASSVIHNLTEELWKQVAIPRQVGFVWEKRKCTDQICSISYSN